MVEIKDAGTEDRELLASFYKKQLELFTKNIPWEVACAIEMWDIQFRARIKLEINGIVYTTQIHGGPVGLKPGEESLGWTIRKNALSVAIAGRRWVHGLFETDDFEAQVAEIYNEERSEK